jgi:predicted aldo/keto reductase-like oxidoreductase
MEQVIENLDSADRSGTGTLSKEELILIDKVREEYCRIAPIACTNCKYCMPCPNGVEIPAILEYYNDAIIYDNPRAPRFLYRNLSEDKRAHQCVECFECEEKCPQGIPISEHLKEAHAWLNKSK